MRKRLFDIVFSLVVLVILLPLLLLIGLVIVLDSKGGAFYKQLRVGRAYKSFYIYKFRTMIVGADKEGFLTVGERDKRITRAGYFLRRYKLDELPQFFNVLKGDMSIVGPRPEVPEYVKLYNKTQRQVLNVKPGITDYASIEFAEESEILAKHSNPEEGYINEILPQKLLLNLHYIKSRSFWKDLVILSKTIKKIIIR